MASLAGRVVNANLALLLVDEVAQRPLRVNAHAGRRRAVRTIGTSRAQRRANLANTNMAEHYSEARKTSFENGEGERTLCDRGARVAKHALRVRRSRARRRGRVRAAKDADEAMRRARRKDRHASERDEKNRNDEKN